MPVGTAADMAENGIDLVPIMRRRLALATLSLETPDQRQTFRMTTSFA